MKSIVISGYGENELTLGLYHDNEFVWHSEIQSPSYCAVFDQYLFAVSELDNGCVLHFYWKTADKYVLKDQKKLTFAGVCHLTFLPMEQVLIGSSYSDGILFTIEVEPNKFGRILQTIEYSKNEKGDSRIHCSLANREESLLYAVNIATDRVYTYELIDRQLKEKAVMVLKKGSGPRHLAFGVEESIVYCITEYSNELYTFNSENGVLSLVQQLPISKGQKGKSFGASCCIDREKHKLYASLRGDNTISAFSIGDGGYLQEADCFSCGGDWPRHIALYQNEYLLCANQESKDVTVLSIKEGSIGQVQKKISFPEPSFVQEI